MPNDASASAIVNGLCLVVAVVVAVFSSQVISCGECCSMMNKFLGSCRWVAGNVRMNSILETVHQHMPPEAGGGDADVPVQDHAVIAQPVTNPP